MPQSSFFGGREVGTSLCWNMKKVRCPKATKLCPSSVGKKKKMPSPTFVFGLFFSWMNFKWLFVRKLLLFQTRIHLSASARIKSTPKGQQTSPTLFLSVWNLQ